MCRCFDRSDEIDLYEGKHEGEDDRSFPSCSKTISFQPKANNDNLNVGYFDNKCSSLSSYSKVPSSMLPLASQ